ncbi:hypothetical protein MRS44_015009 [Fusarium solani]|uniref:MARVEL domain-containing protein n=1 Tax=Fusarium solani TaxID=169388 RepID=A0A9P9GX90_FUSSL|nr:uncharacterized protein B0J15DRAFT_428221 [Fusarium solani]KAH7247203.1 hypothetical protein B0J15DRAFT_428221 [Fusarium solani]KAJ3457868.1 hypothetical protein MRS44_015009 [Fusarium solani]KAJ4219582.1 hypothetical protein NW759_007969 [Fusarium solani]
MANRRPDVLDYPTGTTVLRIFQAILSIIIIIVVSFTVSAGIFAGNGLMLFTSSATLAISLWMIMAHISLAHLYNYWAGLSLDIFLLVFWIISVAVLASQTAFLWGASHDICREQDCPDAFRDATKFSGYIFAAIAGLGGIEFIFSCIFLIFHAIMTFRQRRYNRIGINIESGPIENYPKHPKEPTEYHHLAPERT